MSSSKVRSRREALLWRLAWWALRPVDAAEHHLRRLGWGLREIDPERVLRRVLRSVDVGPSLDDAFVEALEVLVASVNANPDIKLTGRWAFRAYLAHRVANRLRIDATLRAYPEILDEPITRPIFIVGLPRTGTTLLHQLLAGDERLRAPRMWEMEYPCARFGAGQNPAERRFRSVDAKCRFFKTIAPRFPALHQVDAALPEECVYLFANDLMSDLFNTAWQLPEYARWLSRQDLEPLYLRHKQQLQMLQYGVGTARWVLKSPSHLRALRPLARTYPDAFVIQTYRDPARVAASNASLFSLAWSLTQYNVRPEEIGPPMLAMLRALIKRSARDRSRIEARSGSRIRFMDVAYEDLVRDPLSVLRGIYRHCQLEWTSAAEQGARTYLAENPQHKHGRHYYSLEEYGLQQAPFDDWVRRSV